MSSQQPGAPEIKYPDIEVQLSGTDGNAFSVIGRVSKALRRAVGPEAAAEFAAEAMSGDYHNVLATAMRWVDVA
jgi:hypothetical protein